MKVIEKNRLSVSGELQDSVFFGIKQGGFAHIFNVLRNQLYSDKILAVIREYSANAYDAHVESGNDELPFEVTLPNRFDSFFKVRDFGRGLSQEDVRDIYANYGESTKRQSNDYIGQLGLGSKSAFAYSDSFTITSYNGGFKYVYNAFIDESNVGKIVLLEKGATKEVDGIEISVPVTDSYDVNSFKDKAEGLYKYYKVKPIIKGQTIDFGEERIILEGDDWKLRADGTGAVAVMGNIGYRIDNDALGVAYRGDDGLYDLVQMNGLEVYFDIGDLEMAASREGLQYTKHTKSNIIKRLKVLKKDIIKKVQDEFRGCKSHFQAKCLFNDLFDMTNDLYQIRQIVAKDLKFNNLKIDSSNYFLEDEKGTVYTVTTTWRSKKYKAEAINRIEATSKTVIIKNDIGNNRMLLGRLLPMVIEEDKKPFVITFKDDKIEQEFVKQEGFDPEDVIELSSLTKYKMSDLAEKYVGTEYEGKHSIPRVTYGTNGAAGYVKSSKHSCKSFTLDWDVVEKGWHRNASEYWNDTKVDLDEQEGVYVIIDRFKVQDGEGDAYYSRGNIFGNLKSHFENLGIEIPEVFAFKVAMKNKVVDNENWTNFFDWAEETFLEALETEGIVEKWNDYNSLDTIISNWKHDWLFDFEKGGTNLLKKKLDSDDNTLIKFLNKVQDTKDCHKKVEAYTGLMGALRIDKGKFGSKGYDFEKHQEKIWDAYPFLQYADRENIRRNEKKNDFIKRIADYVNLIDSMRVSID